MLYENIFRFNIVIREYLLMIQFMKLQPSREKSLVCPKSDHMLRVCSM